MSDNDEEKDLHAPIVQSELDDAVRDVSAMSDDAIAKENAAAGYDAAAHLAKNLAVLDDAIAKARANGAASNVVPLAAKRHRSQTMWVGLALAAVLLLFIAWQAAKRGAAEDVRVAAPLCVRVTWKDGASAAPASLEGVLRRVTDNGEDLYELELDVPVCRASAPPSSVAEARGVGVDLAGFVGQKVRVEADLADRPGSSHRALLATVRSASVAP